jgi:formamidopyrimidine-DNA glycosylase
VPELPEVEALAAYLRQRAVGRTVQRFEVSSFSALKTYDPPASAVAGLVVTAAGRHGKFLDLSLGTELHLVVHLARAGWLHYRESFKSPAPLKPGSGPIAIRVRLDDESGFDLTEAGTQKSLAAYLVRDPAQVPGVSRLGPDALAVDRDQFAERLRSRSGQVKGVLTDQEVLAGIGNAYSDEILHVAKMSPFKPASNLSADELQQLYDAMQETLRDAVGRSTGLAVQDLKSEKKSGMRVHGRKGQKCPVCGDIVREVSFADSSLQYCATCQTGGKPLADRRLSKLLK